jgi:SAM-dependent methyltransferase
MSEEKKPVDTVEFWKHRLYEAHASGRGIHSAIYNTDPFTWNEIQNQTAGYLKRYIGSHNSVIDVGCGFGALSDLLPDTVKYCGVDISPDLIEIAKLRYPGKEFIIADMSRRTAFATDQFDFAICRSIRSMIIDNLGVNKWIDILGECIRISNVVILMEYDNKEPIVKRKRK